MSEKGEKLRRKKKIKEEKPSFSLGFLFSFY